MELLILSDDDQVWLDYSAYKVQQKRNHRNNVLLGFLVLTVCVGAAAAALPVWPHVVQAIQFGPKGGAFDVTTTGRPFHLYDVNASLSIIVTCSGCTIKCDNYQPLGYYCSLTTTIEYRSLLP